jgi:hypothetical protein
MTRQLPQPVTTSDFYYAAMVEKLDQALVVLGDIRDRLPEPAPALVPQPVAVAEPAPARAATRPKQPPIPAKKAAAKTSIIKESR